MEKVEKVLAYFKDERVKKIINYLFYFKGKWEGLYIQLLNVQLDARISEDGTGDKYCTDQNSVQHTVNSRGRPHGSC